MESLALIAGYLIGSIPSGLLIARGFGGVDIRTVGSGNIGATNVGRVMGMKWFGVVFLLDALKGFGPTLAASFWFAESAAGFWSQQGATLTGAATILGHMYPCFLKFRGGKGVATGLGVVFVLAPLASLIAAAVFAIITAIGRMISLSSILAALTFAVVELLLLSPHPFTPDNLALAIFSIAIPALIIYRHRSNLVRIWQGTENRIGRKAESAEGRESGSPEQVPKK